MRRFAGQVAGLLVSIKFTIKLDNMEEQDSKFHVQKRSSRPSVYHCKVQLYGEGNDVFPAQTKQPALSKNIYRLIFYRFYSVKDEGCYKTD